MLTYSILAYADKNRILCNKHNSLIKTVAKKVNSFRNWLSQQLTESGSSFFTTLQHFTYASTRKRIIHVFYYSLTYSILAQC